MVASDRISAFDVVLPRGIPFKGQVLNLIASKFLNATKDIVPNWLIGTPHPNVSVGKMCEPFNPSGKVTPHKTRLPKAYVRAACPAK